MYPSGNFPNSIIVGDFNNDSKFDLAVTNLNDKSVSVLLGNGNGTFQNRIIYTVGTSPFSIIASAFRDDTKLDMVVTNAGDNNVIILLNSCS